MNEHELDLQTRIEQLCPACGLCCNGVLFGDVEIQGQDDAKRLSALGITLGRKGRKVAFPQPCSCFDGRWCRIYADRPAQCRAFECRILKRVLSREMTLARAQSLIKQVQSRVKIIINLMRHLGNVEERLALSRRYTQIMTQPIDLAGDEETIEARAQLMLEVDKLMKVVLRDFLS